MCIINVCLRSHEKEGNDDDNLEWRYFALITDTKLIHAVADRRWEKNIRLTIKESINLNKC